MPGVADDASDFLLAAHVYIMPSARGAAPRALVEAMAHRTPIVSVRTPEIEHAISQAQHGLLVRPGSSDELAEAITAVLGEPGEAKNRASAAQRRGAAQFSLERMMHGHVDLYRKVILAARERCDS
jgi:glycosyltransferase involved in cell wall biosynthesis